MMAAAFVQPAQDLNLIAAAYDAIFPDVYREADTEVIEESLEESGGPLLDLGCGTGSIISMALQRKIQVIGVDESQPMLDVVRAKFGEKSAVRLIQGHMATVDYPRDMGTIICVGNTFPLVHGETAQRELLRKCARSLRPDGNMVVTIKNPGNPDPATEMRVQRQTEIGDVDFHLKWTNDWTDRDMLRGMRTYVMTVKIDERTEEYVFYSQLISLDAFREAVRDSGLEVVSVYGGAQKQPWTPTSVWHIIKLKRMVPGPDIGQQAAHTAI